ncbi:hypothetical protein F5X96DRAFT_665282 [Biscogniauxia mediterranea]|nr:hypothetical protein F5X96DRAFT_665282 [Biscogniauxia mediterranea]
MSYLRSSTHLLRPVLLLRTQPTLTPTITTATATATTTPSSSPSSSSARLSRALHGSAARARPYKDDMDRESLKPKAHENTQSGTDDSAATMTEDAAFDPSKTSPEAEKASAGESARRRGEVSPLEASPADRDFGGAAGGGGGGGGGGGTTAEGGQEKMKMKGKEKSQPGSAPKQGKVV